MGSRRKFLQQSILAGAAFSVPAFDLLGYMHPKSQIPDAPKISLAQWSLHRSLRKGELKAEEFPLIAKALFGIQAVEYVNEFYTAELEDQAFWQQLRRRAESEGVQNLLIMVDEAGELGALQKKARDEAIDLHRKWLEAAKLLGCHSIRVNAFGQGSREELKPNLVDGLGRLAEAGAELGMNILIENHGGKFPAWLAPVQAVVMNITDRQSEYCEKVAETLENKGFRVDLDLRNEKIGYKIRQHTLARVPYLLVVGDREVEEGAVAVRTREGEDLGSMALADFAERLAADVERRG